MLITAVIVFALDSAFKLMNTYGINKIKEAVDSRNEVINETTAEEETESITSEEVENQETQTESTTSQEVENEETQTETQETTEQAQ